MSRKIVVRMKWIKIFRNWMIVVKSWNADRMMNHKFVKEHEMILKAYENFSKNKRIINIRDDFFRKICCLSIIETENDHNLKSRSLKFLKLSVLIFFLSIKFIEFLVVRFNTFFLHQLSLLNFLSFDFTRLFKQWNLSDTTTFSNWN